MRIEWNKPGERFFETGVDQGVLYPRAGAGVPWNGLVAVNESSSGGELEGLYFDGVKFRDVQASEEFQATLEAFAAPAEFAACDGTKQLAPGLFVTQQPRQSFGLSYRTLIGNDLVGTDYGYKLHIVYNCTAGPSGRNNQTIAGSLSPSTRSWSIETVPPPATNFKPTAHIVLDSTKVDPFGMQQIEALLYGHDGGDARLPSVAEIVDILATPIPEFITEFI